MTDRCWHYTKLIDDDTLGKMNIAAQHFVGTHDFSAYMAANSSVKSTVRTIYEADVCRDGEMIVFRVRGNGFLYNMVRIFMGTLIAVAEGKIQPEDIPNITSAKKRSLAGVTAPAQGLYLNKVVY